MSFQKGDKVRCIDAGESDGLLTANEIYTIKFVDPSGTLYFERLPYASDLGWWPYRFEKAEEVTEKPPMQQETKFYDAKDFTFVVNGVVQDMSAEVPEKDADCKDTNPKDAAASDRLDISLFPATAIAYGALAMTEGHFKYGGYNWREAGVLASVYYSAMQRHLMKWFNGEHADSKTGVPHLASVLACVAILVDASECGMLKDDRPPGAPVSEMLHQMEFDVARLRQMYPNGPGRKTEYGT